jgi:hypothetical protein
VKRSRFTWFGIERPFPWLLLAIVFTPVWLVAWVVTAVTVMQIADGRLDMFDVI